MDGSTVLSPAPRPHVSITVRLTVLLAATLLAFVLGEAGVRLLGIDHLKTDIGAVPHPRWHHWHRGDHEFDYVVHAEGFTQRVRFNSLGMRDSAEVTVAKPAGVLRVAVLGDSFVEALQVAEHEGICKRLEACLRSVGVRGRRADFQSARHVGRIGNPPYGTPTPTQVLNFGCSGFSSTLEAVLARAWVRDFAPDLVVCLHHFSDITEDWSYSSRARWQEERVVAVAPAESALSPALRQCVDMSQLVRAGRGAIDAWRRHRPPRADVSLQESFDAIVHDPCTPRDDEAWAYSLRGVGDMAATFREAGVPFLLVIIPIGPQIEPVGQEEAARIGFRFLAGGARLEQRGYQEKVRRYCQEHGIACLDLLDIFRASNPSGERRLYWRRDQHWTAAGHDLAAWAIADRLVKFATKKKDH